MGGGASIGAPVVVSSPHRGDLLSVGGRVTVDSRVDGDLWVVGADAELSPRAEVTGNVVVIGGRLNASPRAVVGGTMSQLPGLKVPLLGVLGTQFSAQALELGRRCPGLCPLRLGAVPELLLPCHPCASDAAGLAVALAASPHNPCCLPRGDPPGRRSDHRLRGRGPPAAAACPGCLSPGAGRIHGTLHGHRWLGPRIQGAQDDRKRRVAFPFYLWSARAVPGERARSCPVSFSPPFDPPRLRGSERCSRR